MLLIILIGLLLLIFKKETLESQKKRIIFPVNLKNTINNIKFVYSKIDFFIKIKKKVLSIYRNSQRNKIFTFFKTIRRIN